MGGAPIQIEIYLNGWVQMIAGNFLRFVHNPQEATRLRNLYQKEGDGGLWNDGHILDGIDVAIDTVDFKLLNEEYTPKRE